MLLHKSSLKLQKPGYPFSLITKTTNLISRILFLNYHLSTPVITGGMLLPTLSLERAALKTALYVTLQHPRFTRYWCYHQQP